jgi:hypothetical protein
MGQDIGNNVQRFAGIGSYNSASTYATGFTETAQDL